MAILSAWKDSGIISDHAWRKMAFGAGKFVAVSNNGHVAYSSNNGRNWSYTTGPGGWPIAIAYGNGKFVVAGNGSALSTSPDGVTWAFTRPLSDGATWQDMAFGNGVFVIVTSTGSCTVSADLVQWQVRTLPTTQSYTGIAFGNGKFVACTRGSVAVSTDGITWQSKNTPNNTYWQEIAFHNGVFMLGGQDGRIAYSTDNGETWTEKKINAAGLTASCVAGGNGIFVVGFANSLVTAYSKDGGATWTEHTNVTSSRWQDMAFANNTFVMIGDSDGKCVYAVANSAPTPPNGITVPDMVEGGKAAAISWGASTDIDINLAGYILERSANGGAWQQIYKGTMQSFSDTVTYGWTSVAWRVKAYDQDGAESAYTTSQTRTVVNNRLPAISGADGSIGTFGASFTAQTYTVTDADNDAVTVVETLDGVQLRSFTATLGSTNTISFAPAVWQQMLNGTHTLRITATDAKGAVAVRNWTFVKAQNSLSVAFSAPLPADAMPLRCIVTVQGSFPTGSTLKVEVCNNGNDAAPTWEDITQKVLGRQKHFFNNTTKTAASWGVNVRVTLTRDSATGPCYVESVGGNFA